MIAHAQHRWDLDIPIGKSSMGDHLTALKRQGKLPPSAEAAMIPPPLPSWLMGAWAAFCALDASRSCGMSVNPISYPDIDAYNRLSGADLTPFEVAAIRAVDVAYLAHLAKRREAKA